MHEDDVTVAVLGRVRLADYVDGVYTPQEQAELDIWLAADPQRAVVLHQLRRVWETGNAGVHPELDTQQLWENVTRQTFAGRSPLPRFARAGDVQRHDRRRLGRMGGWLAAGAAVVAMLIIGVTTQIWDISPDRAAPHVYTTGTGERTTITLPDGSTATLAPLTMLAVDAEFGDATRTVHLAGEALFVVHDHDRHPFLVRAGADVTRVLGTEFSVRYATADSTTEVSVLSGKVAVEGRHAPAIVTSGRAARITDTATILLGAHARAHYTDWTEGQLVFQSVPVPVLLQTMEQWYGYQFRVRDSAIVAKTVTVRLKMSDVRDALHILKGLLDVELQFDGATITLSAKPATLRRPAPARRPHTSSTTTEIG